MAPRPTSTVCFPLAVHGYTSLLLQVPRHGWLCSLLWCDRCTAWATRTGLQRPESVLPRCLLSAGCAILESSAEVASGRSRAAGTVRTRPTAHSCVTGGGWLPSSRTRARGGAVPRFCINTNTSFPPLVKGAPASTPPCIPRTPLPWQGLCAVGVGPSATINVRGIW